MREDNRAEGDVLELSLTKGNTAANIYQGWVMVAISFMVIGISRGDQYISGVFIKPFQEMFGAPISSILFSTTGITTLVSGIVSPIMGIMIQRYSTRTFMLLAMAWLGTGYAVLAQASQLWHVGFAYGVFISVGLVGTALAANTLVMNWFSRNRGLAMGIATSGAGVAGILMIPLATYAIDRFGFPITSFALAITALLILPFIGWLVVDRPPDSTDSIRKEMKDRAHHFTAAEMLCRILKNPLFWIVAGYTALISGVVFAVISNMMPLAENLGIERQQSSFLVSGLAVFVLIGMIGFGKLFDILEQRICIRLLVGTVLLASLLLLAGPGFTRVAFSAALLGIAGGACTILPAVLCGINFSRETFAVSIGVLSPFLAIGVTGGIIAMGHAYDVYGSYEVALIGFVLISAALMIGKNPLPLNMT